MNKVIIVTGASKGIGKEISKEQAKHNNSKLQQIRKRNKRTTTRTRKTKHQNRHI